MASFTRSFQVRSRFELVVDACRNAVISAPALGDGKAQLRSKDLLTAGAVASDEKHTLEEHIEDLGLRQVIEPERPLLVLGLRNNLVNPRAIVILDGKAHAAKGETPELSAREYFGIGWRDGSFVASKALGSAGDKEAWQAFFSGIPVLWDDLDGEALLDCILTEASDHSHVFDLPRGNHPAASEESLAAWSALHQVFRANLHADFRVAARAMRQAVRAVSHPLHRDTRYLHSILGVDDRGRLVNVAGHGRLEELGQAARALGCRRAVCVENSGSIMPTLLAGGWKSEPIALLRAPNFRPRGRALLALELENTVFETLVPPAPSDVTLTGTG